MPCRLNAGLHEGRNEVTTVPSRIPPNTLPGANAWDPQWEAKTPWNFTVACRCSASSVA